MIGPAAGPPPRRLRRRLAIGAILGMMVAIVAAQWILRHRPAGPNTPDPNGYDDLTRAGSMVRWVSPEKGNPAQAGLATFRPSVQSNRPALDLARVGLGRQSLAHFPDNQAGLAEQVASQSRLRRVAWILTAEGTVAEADGRIADASRSYLDGLRLGQAATQGEMLTGAQLGWFLQKPGIDRLRKLRDRLPPEEVKRILRELDTLDRHRVPVEAVVARWERWYRGAFGTISRIVLRANGVEAIERSTQQFQARKAHDAAARSLRFLMVELAIHAHHQDQGTWPKSMAELVPAYLASVPIDPATGRALDYPASPSGELTDDLGAIARPDGQVSPRP